MYARLGFKIDNTHHEPDCGDQPVWAWLQSEHGASRMLTQAHAPGDRTLQGDPTTNFSDIRKVALVIKGDKAY